ncbi:MAG: peptidase M19 [Lysobacteraceae bacterium]|nr:MAG: peptidase M19 [Xanthomonadaceae bacterium]
MPLASTRRRFLARALLAATAPLLARAAASPARTGYSDAFVVDGLGGPGRASGKPGPELDARDLADVRASGIDAANVTVGSVGSYANDHAEALRSIAFWDAQVAAHPQVLLKFSRFADLDAARRSRRLALIYGFQDTTAFGEDLGRVEQYHRLGVRIVQLTYNRRNLVGDGCLEAGNAGLSRFGHELLERLDAHRMLTDLSHCGQRTTDEAIARSSGVVAITHTGCAALADLPRNKPDATLRRLADRGGVVGIYLMPYLRTAGQPMASDVIAHVEHALKVCGEDHVGIGTDNPIGAVDADAHYKAEFAKEIAKRRALGISAPGERPDVYTFVPDLNTPRRFETLAALLAARGHADRVIAKVLGGNFKRLFEQAWA